MTVGQQTGRVRVQVLSELTACASERTSAIFGNEDKIQSHVIMIMISMIGPI